MGWETRSVAAADVTVGDELYSANKGDAPCYWWHRIKSVTPHESGSVVIEAGGFTTWKHPAEGVTVRKWVD